MLGPVTFRRLLRCIAQQKFISLLKNIDGHGPEKALKSESGPASLTATHSSGLSSAPAVATDPNQVTLSTALSSIVQENTKVRPRQRRYSM